jgi:ribosomal protein S21
MAITRVRVEARRLRGNTLKDKELNFKALHQEFKKRVSDAGILHQLKEHQYYESKGEKARKKRKEMALKHHQEVILEAIQRGESPKGASKFRKRKSKKRK